MPPLLIAAAPVLTAATVPAAGPVRLAPDVVEVPARWFDWFLGAPLQSVAAVAVGVVVLALARWLITRAVRSVVQGGARVRRGARRLLVSARVGSAAAESDQLVVARRVQRAETMGSVLRSSAAFLVAVGVLTAIANINDWDLGPVLASAGVVGVALGFGAQTLVKDFLAGIFMLVEDQYGVGDVVDLGEASGTVEAVGLRVTQVRDLSGTLWYVRNGEILRVGNKTQGWSRALVELRVGPDQDVEHVAGLIRAAAASIVGDETVGPMLLDEPEVTSFEDLTGESVMIRTLVKTAPSKQWEVQRELRSRIRATLVAEGVALALPRREVLVERDVAPAGEPSASDASAGGTPRTGARQDQSSTG
ncbi:mechanosensitive ion channel family protein [Actinotalea ferrariae]|uniref:mechanosensitive ion channel family protein n=1 Tax=Actinotalea ferrariae TaxID=1386098 RepID=UPI001C8B6DB2|nr:mechanosensitive ion channel family protein [Actinotalea ferrariae]MBX9245917.1 mechanosensitive ion channel family protein [Actinotalea ferrariae]